MKICITGGAGYVGTALTKHLLKYDHQVTVLDTFWYGDFFQKHKNLIKIPGDIRSKTCLNQAFKNQDAVIHLACVSNDPSFDLNPKLGKSINYSCFYDILKTLKECEIERFIYASSSSVYGVNSSENVTEESEIKPLTDYSKFKYRCELELKTFGTGLTWTIVRPATVCGYSDRMRLDLVVNLLTIQALVNKRITVLGGDQLRPNINIKDMVLAYDLLLNAPHFEIENQTFNIGYENLSVNEIAELIKKTLGLPKLEIMHYPSDDNRSYHVDSNKISKLLDFKPKYTISDAINSISVAYHDGLFKDPLNNPIYSNIKQMKAMKL